MSVRVVARMAVKTLGAAILGAATLVTLDGCCRFFPCHRATYLVGNILDKDGTALAGARVEMYSMTTTADAAGCFKIGGPDALPFELAIVSDGYEPFRVESRPGYFDVKVTLVRIGEQIGGQIDWRSISESDFRGTH